MRRVAGLVLFGLLVGGVTWQVASAAPPDPVSLCLRAGADVRAPDSRGRCPSGYVLTDVERFVEDDGGAANIGVFGEVFPAPGNGNTAAGSSVPEGPLSYTISCSETGALSLRVEGALLDEAVVVSENTSGDTGTSHLADGDTLLLQTVAPSDDIQNQGTWRVSVQLTDGRVLTFDGLSVADADETPPCSTTHIRLTITL